MGARDQLAFLGAVLRHPARVGAIAPSSAALARVMVRDLAVPAGRSVIEFGPGTGPFTAAIRQVIAEPGQYLGIERDGRFVAHLRRRFPELRFVEGSAERASAYHAEAGLGEVAAVLCGLPFASLPPTVQDAVMASLDALLPAGGRFRTFQYVHACALPTAIRFRRRMASLFGPGRCLGMVMANLPPALVLEWRRG